MTVLNQQARALLESDALVQLVTLNADGSPQVSCVWVGLDGDDIVSGHLDQRQKLAYVYLGPNVIFPPPLEAKPGGYILRITPQRIGGIGPWTGG